MHRHDRRRLLRPLRQSSRRTPIHCGRGSGISGITRPCREDWPYGRRSGIGIAHATERLYAARVYRHDRRRLLRRLRQSTWRSPVHSSKGSGFSGIARPCRQDWPNGSHSGIGIPPETEKLYAARVHRHNRRRLLRRLRQSSGGSPVRCSGFGGVTRSCQRAWPNSSPGVDTPSCPC
jgi:hypothetical protein